MPRKRTPAAPGSPSVFADNFRRFRSEVGATVDELAQEIGVASHTVTSWEKGVREPNGYALVRLAAALGREPREFFEGPSATLPPSEAAFALRQLRTDLDEDLVREARIVARELNRKYREQQERPTATTPPSAQPSSGR